LLERSGLDETPFPHSVVEGLLADDVLRRLAAQFPTSGWHERAGDDGEKSWHNQVLNLVTLGREANADRTALTGPWGELARALLSDQYRRAVSHHTGVDLEAASIDANLFLYGSDEWLGPHLDLASKIVTHVIYFNSDWRPDYGGCLRILRSKDASDCHREILPTLGRSVFLVRTDHSWHEVRRVTAASARPRRSVQITFWSPGSELAMGPLPYYGGTR
jgi:hypothetical protein